MKIQVYYVDEDLQTSVKEVHLVPLENGVEIVDLEGNSLGRITLQLNQIDNKKLMVDARYREPYRKPGSR